MCMCVEVPVRFARQAFNLTELGTVGLVLLGIYIRLLPLRQVLTYARHQSCRWQQAACAKLLANSSKVYIG